jgi:hypothetical protein
MGTDMAAHKKRDMQVTGKGLRAGLETNLCVGIIVDPKEPDLAAAVRFPNEGLVLRNLAWCQGPTRIRQVSSRNALSALKETCCRHET